MSSSHCKGCGQSILWRVTPNGKPMPLDDTYTKAPLTATGTYVLSKKTECIPFDLATHGPNAPRYMNHWATCPTPNQFRSK